MQVVADSATGRLCGAACLFVVSVHVIKRLSCWSGLLAICCQTVCVSCNPVTVWPLWIEVLPLQWGAGSMALMLWLDW
jgi:hypothetical protein